MLKSLLLAAAAIGAMSISGCLIIASDGGERTVVAMPGEGLTAVRTDAYAAAISDPLRPAEEVARDPLRHPADILAFAQVEAGDKVADIRPGAGYFTRLFARSVGATGHVYAYVPNRTAERENATADILVAAYPNVTRVNGDLDTLAFDQPLDAIFMSQEYHDFTIPRFGVDVTKMNAAAFAALKPGGLFVVVDHQAADGVGISVAGTLHRIEGAELRREVEAAGFVFDGQTSVLENPDDDHTINVFDEAIRGKTDQFAYRFRKPG